MSEKNNTEQILSSVLEGIQKVKGQDITILDLRGIENAVCRQTPQKPWHVEGEQNAEWVLLDYVDVVVHIFQKHVREYYDIEGLWGDAQITHINTNE